MSYKRNCSFCLRSEDDVKLLIAGPCGSICNVCADLAVKEVELRLVAAPDFSQGTASEPAQAADQIERLRDEADTLRAKERGMSLYMYRHTPP